MIKTNGIMNWILSGVSLVMISYHLIAAPDTEYSTKSMIFWCMLHLLADIRLTLGKISITAMVMPSIQQVTSQKSGQFKELLEDLAAKIKKDQEEQSKEEEK